MASSTGHVGEFSRRWSCSVSPERSLTGAITAIGSFRGATRAVTIDPTHHRPQSFRVVRRNRVDKKAVDCVIEPLPINSGVVSTCEPIRDLPQTGLTARANLPGPARVRRCDTAVEPGMGAERR